MSATSTAETPPSADRPTTTRKTNRLLLALELFAAIILAAFLGLGLWPVSADMPGDEATAGLADDWSGLIQPFPGMIVPADNLVTHENNTERVELGRLLFFDPVLSANNDLSCATCHHPDLGFSDGRQLSLGNGGIGVGPTRTGGASTRRSAPSLWNAGYHHRQFWDGRAKDLEEQAISPLINQLEMAEDPARLLSELRLIPEYVDRFEKAFAGAGGASISLETIAKALAAFERSLTANNTAFDRYVAGDRTALTDAQRRGFTVFRSGKIRCIECHGLPTFSDRDFKSVGQLHSGDQPDLGRFEITKGQADRFAFKVPTLRNVVLSAPYMHNGALGTLEDVIDFYSSGGRPRIGTPVDDKLRAFALTTEEKQDLIAFLFSLTDESNLPIVPERVPSGLPVIPRLDNPARKLAANYNRGSAIGQSTTRSPQLLRVEAGQSIQQAIDKAAPGDTIAVMPGVYHEHLVVDVDNLTLQAVVATNGSGEGASTSVPMDGSRRPLLDGKKEIADGVTVSGSNFRFVGFDIKHYTANAVFAQYSRNPALTDLRVEKSGRFGIHLIKSSGGTIESVRAYGMGEIGLCINSSRNTTVRNCEVYGNVIGIHAENCLNTVIEANSIYDNTCGVLVTCLPNNISTVGKNCLVTGNHILSNNARNSGELGTLIGDLPQGAGILILAADNTEVTANEIRGNASYAVAVLGFYSFLDSGLKIDLGSVPENNFIHDNTYSDNGVAPAPSMLKAGFEGADLVWDLSGWSNKWLEREASRDNHLLDARWPSFARRAYWRVLRLL